MKITINGSPEELAELMTALLNGTDNKAKKTDFPPLLTELAEDEKINEPTVAVRNADKENAPQSETTEHKNNQEVFEKQMELLSQASKDCLSDIYLYQYLPALTQAMILIELLHV